MHKGDSEVDSIQNDLNVAKIALFEGSIGESISCSVRAIDRLLKLDVETRAILAAHIQLNFSELYGNVRENLTEDLFNSSAGLRAEISVPMAISVLEMGGSLLRVARSVISMKNRTALSKIAYELLQVLPVKMESAINWLISKTPIDGNPTFIRMIYTVLMFARYRLNLTFGNLHIAKSVEMLKRYLNESDKNARSIVLESTIERRLSENRDFDDSRSLELRNRIANSMVWEERSQFKDLQRFYSQKGVPRIVVFFHMGFGQSASVNLVKSYGPDLKLYTIVQDERSYIDRYMRIQQFPKGVVASQLSSRHLSILGLVSKLRSKSNSVVHIYCDLWYSFGKTVEVQFLGRKARFSCGVAEIAMLSKAPIFPVITFGEGRSHHIVTKHIIDPSDYAGATIQDGAARITQRIVGYYEPYIRRFPAQWRFILSMENFFVGEEGVNDY